MGTATSEFLDLAEIVPSVTLAGHWRFKQPKCFRYRVPGHHLLLVGSGKLLATVPQGQFEASEGDLLCFRPADQTEYSFDGPVELYQAHLWFAAPPKHRLTPWIPELGPLPLRVSLNESYDAARQVFETLCMEIGSAGSPHSFRQRAAVFELLALIASSRAEAAARPPQRLDPWQRVKLKLESDLKSDLPVAALAGKMGVSVSYFIRQFKKRFGDSPKVCHHRARLHEAARRLRSGDRSIKQVAYEIGFSNPRIFARAFKRHFGVTPSDVRLSHPITGHAESNSAAYLLNRHLLPPGTDGDWVRQYQPKT